MGLWIGLSLVDVIDFFGCLYEICQYKYSKKKKRVTNHSLKPGNFKWNKTVEKTIHAESVEDSGFEKCQVSNIADISTSSSKKETLQKLSVFLFCLCGFSWQTWRSLNIYWLYKTMTKESIIKPLRLERPAITVCDPTMRSRFVECRNEPSDCIFIERHGFCEEYPQYCMTPFGKLLFFERDLVNDTELYQIFAGELECHTEKCSWEKIDDLNYPFYFIHDELQLSQKKDHPLFEYVTFTTRLGEPAECMTYGSEQGENIEPVYASTGFNTRIALHLFLTDFMDPMENISFYISIHDAKRIVNPFRHGVKLQSFYRYHIQVTEMEEQTLLPFPYDTNCTDYFKEWLENNRSGPLTTMECVEECQFNYMLVENQCIPRSLSIHHQENLCNKGEKVSSDILDYCVDQCGPPCLEKTYKLKIAAEKKFLPYGQMRKMTETYGNVQLLVSYRSIQYKQITTEPSMKDIDLYINVGGYLGIWIGLSMVSFLDIIYRFLFSLLNGRTIWKSKNNNFRITKITK